MKMKLFSITILWFFCFYVYVQNLSGQLFFSQENQHDLNLKPENLKNGGRYFTRNHVVDIPFKGEGFDAKHYLGSSKWTIDKKSTSNNPNTDKIIFNKPFYVIESTAFDGASSNHRYAAIWKK